jgi:hypothetical protein
VLVDIDFVNEDEARMNFFKNEKPRSVMYDWISSPATFSRDARDRHSIIFYGVYRLFVVIAQLAYGLTCIHQ